MQFVISGAKCDNELKQALKPYWAGTDVKEVEYDNTKAALIVFAENVYKVPLPEIYNFYQMVGKAQKEAKDE